MTNSLPKVTVLIAARPEQTEVKAVTASRAFDYPADKLEIIVARGKQPSVQRNAALKAAVGELIYFLDDDSVPDPGNLHKAVQRFSDPQVQMVGGPNLCPPDAPALEKVFALVLGSWLAFGPSRARYTPVGVVRPTSEKELILCNLAARRQAMLDLGGFDEALYPNEENALMDELQKRNGKLLYDPQFIVHRRPRSNLRAFARMLMTYGRGRAEQFRLHPTFGSAPNFVPPLLCAYLVLAPILVWQIGPLALVLLLLYVLILLAQFGVLARHAPPLQAIAAVPLIGLTHVLYGLGFWRGLFTRLKSAEQRSAGPPMPVVLETVQLENRLGAPAPRLLNEKSDLGPRDQRLR